MGEKETGEREGDEPGQREMEQNAKGGRPSGERSEGLNILLTFSVIAPLA